MGYDEEELCKIITVSKIMGEKLSPSEMAKLISLIQDFDKHRISHGEFSKSLQLLFAQKDQEDGNTRQEVEDTELEEGEIPQDYHLRKIFDNQAESNHLAIIRAKGEGNSKKYGHPKIGADLQVRVKEDVTNVFNLEGKKRRILHSDTSDDERSLKKARTSSKRLERVSPSYELIPEEAQCPVKDTVLNNKCRLKGFDNASGHSRLTKYQVAMAVSEDEMFETDMLMAALRSAMETLFLGRLKQKLDELTSAKEVWKSGWKEVFEENTAKQKRFHSKRPKENNKF